MAYPALDPRELPSMKAGTARALIEGRVALMEEIHGAAPSRAPAPEPEGIRWEQARPGPNGTTRVPVQGLEGLKQFLAMNGG